MTDFTPWTLAVDLGIISLLILIGKLMRAKLRFIQRLFIPPSVIAGFMGLLLGPEICGWLPLSDRLGTYAGILIAFVFGSIPLASSDARNPKGGIKSMWTYSQAGMLLQWAFGGLFGIFVLSRIWNLTDGFGIAMPTGYCGGHGSAAAVGQAFANFGDDEMMTLAMTAATVGILAAIIIGLALIKYGTRHGHTACLDSFENLSPELRTGLVEKHNRESLGEATCSSISISPITFNLAIIAVVVLGGYGISRGVAALYPQLELPVFSCAFIVGIVIKTICRRTRIGNYVCPKTVSHLSNAFTDYLVAFGISSIKISVVVQYIAPLTILLVIGLVVTLIYVFVAAKVIFKEYWFEKAMFTWGWYTGTMAMGIALLRIVDADNRSRCMDSYAVAYLLIAPVEIALITFAPLAFTHGFGVGFSLICLSAGVAILCCSAICRRKKRKAARL